MANMSLTKNPMPSQDPNVRNKNFQEVALGYTEEQALDEAARCLNCKAHPCVNGCPVNVRIPEFIQKILEKDYEGAYQVIHQTSSLPAVCGRVCPQETQCEMHCVRGKKGEAVGIGRLERFVADWHNAHSTEAPEKPQSNGHKVAVVGSGPAGLACAGELARMGYAVTVYEALHTPGGVLAYGIPAFRLPKSILSEEIAALTAMGVSPARACFRAVVPDIAPGYLTNALYLLETNVRHSAILGYVGAGGLGILLNEKIAWREWSRVGTILLLLYGVVFTVETFSSWLRRLLAAQGFFSGSTLYSTISGISTGSIIWATMPSAKNSTGIRYFSALSKANIIMSIAS